MAKYEVNKGYTSEHHVVEAATFVLKDGWFVFTDNSGAAVFTIAQPEVHTIEREGHVSDA